MVYIVVCTGLFIEDILVFQANDMPARSTLDSLNMPEVYHH